MSYYRGTIGEVLFSITLPYCAAGPGVERLGFAQERVDVKLEFVAEGQGGRYSFVLPKPPKVFYIVKLPAGADA